MEVQDCSNSRILNTQIVVTASFLVSSTTSHLETGSARRGSRRLLNPSPGQRSLHSRRSRCNYICKHGHCHDGTFSANLDDEHNELGEMAARRSILARKYRLLDWHQPVRADCLQNRTVGVQVQSFSAKIQFDLFSVPLKLVVWFGGSRNNWSFTHFRANGHEHIRTHLAQQRTRLCHRNGRLGNDAHDGLLGRH